MPFELIFAVAILFLSFALLLADSKKALFVLLFLSVLLHKELFSIYSWNVLPARIFMASLAVFVIYRALKEIKTKGLLHVASYLASPVVVFLGAFLFVAGLSLFFSRNLTASLLVYAFLITVFCLYIYLVFTFDGNHFAVLKVLKVYVFIGFILSVIGFVQIWVYKKYDFIFGAFWNVPGHLPRIGSLFWDVNHFAGFLALLLPVSFALILTAPWWQKVLFGFSAVSMLAALVLTNARSGWIAAGIGVLVFALLLVYKKLRYKGIVAIAGVILVVFGLLFWQYLDRQSPVRREIRKYFHYRLDSFDSHLLLLNGAWQVFEKYPILGGGYGSFYEHFAKTKISATFFARDPAALNTRVPAHSIWGELLAETGAMGFSLMLWFYLTVILLLVYTTLKSKSKQTFLFTAAMAGSILGILVAGIFYSYNSEFFWLIVFMYFLYGLYSLKWETGETNSSRLWSDVFSTFISNPKFPPFVLVVLSSLLIFVNLGSNKLIPYDEAIYAKVSQNILTTKDWITLYWNGSQPWFEKPPLYFWLSALLLNVIPTQPELAVRLPSAVFGFLSVLVAYYFGKNLFGKTAGFVSGLSLLTTFHFLYYSRLGMLDVTCGFFILLSLYLYYQVDWHKTNYLKTLFAGMFMGLAVLTKGAVGFLPAIIIFVYEIFRFLILKRTGSVLNLRILRAVGLRIFVFLVISCLVFMPWHVVMFKLHGHDFLNSYLGYHVLGRATLETENKTGPIYWYLIVLKVSMRIWFLALVPAFFFALYRLISLKSQKENLLVVLVWFLVVLILFSVSKTKLVWYIMPIYPAASLLIGYFYSTLLNFLDSKISKFRYISSFLLKVALVYITTLISLLYLFANKNLVYTSDLTGAQVQMMQTKNALYGAEKLVYLDRIELPLALFYAGDRFVITDFSELKDFIGKSADKGSQLLFITKESRFNQLKQIYPQIKLVDQKNEWRFGEVPGI